MRKILFLFILTVTMFATSEAFADWTVQNSPTSELITSVNFVNPTTGYIGCRFAKIYKTTNGGVNWTQQGLAALGALDISYIFINPINQNYVYAVGNNGVFHKTTNAGANWTFTDLGANDLKSVVFFDLLNGLTGAYGPFMYKTSDGGSNWVTVNTGLPTDNYYDSYITGNAVYFTTSTGKVIKSTNAGVNWTIQQTGSNQPLPAILFKDNNTGYVGTLDGKIYKTTNAGTNWFIHSDFSSAVSIYDITSNGIEIFACCNSGRIFKNIDGGSAWYEQTTGTGEILFDIHFADLFTGYSVGSNGTIIKTTNGGNPIGIVPVSNEVPDGFSLLQNYPNPFNPVTNIEFTIPQAANVKLSIFDISSKVIEIITDQKLGSGRYMVDFDASQLSSGIYFYKLETDKFIQTKKMMLVK